MSRVLLFSFSLLYFVQGAAVAYFTNLQKPYLRSLGIPLESVGLLTSLLLLPFVMKVFFGWWSDRRSRTKHGGRKPFMVAGLILAAVCFLLCALIPPERNFFLFSSLMILASTGISLFDAATDGLAIDSTPESSYSKVQAYMVGGRASGVIVLSLVFGFLSQSIGFKPVFLVLGLLPIVPLLALRAVKESESILGTAPPRFAMSDVVQTSFVLFALYGALYPLASFGIDGIMTLFLSEDYGVNHSGLGVYGSLRGVGAILGAAALAIAMRTCPKWLTAGLGLAMVGLVGIFMEGLVLRLGVQSMALVWGAVWGFQETCFFALAMGFTGKVSPAFVFAILMAVSNLGNAFAESLSAFLVGQAGFTGAFPILGLLVVLPTIPLYYCLRAVHRTGSILRGP